DIARGGGRLARVVRGDQHDPAGRAIHDGGRVAVRVAAAVVHHLHRRPRLAAVVRAFQHDVDGARVVAVLDAPLGDGEQGATRGFDDGGNPVAGVPGILGRLEQDLLVE